MVGKASHEYATTDKETSKPHKPPIWFFWRARRYILIMLTFFGFFNCYALRVNLSVAIVAMTQFNNITLPNGTTVLHREFDWSTRLQGYLLSSFFYGYLFTQLIGGYLAVRFGGKPVFAAGIGVASILTLLSPFAAKINVFLFLVVRIVEGVFEGMIIPCLHSLVSKWAPPSERSRLTTIALSGTYVGTVVSLPLSSVLASYLGWESIFYVFGVMGCIWTIFWLIIIKNSPEEDPLISKHELAYITESLEISKPIKTKLKIPWRSIVTSRPLWAYTIGVTCEIWGYYTLLTQLPKFMKYCLHFDLNGAGAMSALPYVAVTIVLQGAGHLADYLSTRKILTITGIRKIFVGVGFMGQFIFLILSVHWLSKFGTIFCLLIAVGFGGFAMATFCVNSLDLAPNYGSLMVAVSNTFATIPGIISPIMTGYIVTDESSVEQWRIIFYTTAFIYLFGSIIYVSFGSGELQSWDNTENKEINEEKGHNNKGFNTEDT